VKTSRTTTLVHGAALLLGAARLALAQAAPPPPIVQHSREVRWFRDSEEYATQARMIYRQAARAVEAAVRQLPRGQAQPAWAVVLDVDETALDNSVYQLDRAAYGVPFDTASWNAFVNRRQSPAVPGAVEFVAAVRRLGGRVAWITNRAEAVRAATQANLASAGLWHDGDRLCLLSADPAYTKGARRAEVASGSGACAWEGQRVTIVAFVGDAMGDFPAAGEGDADAGNDAAFGVRYFLLANPMYGSWERRPTRRP
jgi:5'-nucleotidase (lipoprotein e(P4) family)